MKGTPQPDAAAPTRCSHCPARTARLQVLHTQASVKGRPAHLSLSVPSEDGRFPDACICCNMPASGRAAKFPAVGSSVCSSGRLCSITMTTPANPCAAAAQSKWLQWGYVNAARNERRTDWCAALGPSWASGALQYHCMSCCSRQQEGSGQPAGRMRAARSATGRAWQRISTTTL